MIHKHWQPVHLKEKLGSPKNSFPCREKLFFMETLSPVADSAVLYSDPPPIPAHIFKDNFGQPHLRNEFPPELFLRILPHKIGEDECDSRPDNYVNIIASYFRLAQDAGMIILCADNFQPQTSLPSGQLSLQLCPLLLHLVSTKSSLPQTWSPTWPSLLTTVL